MLNMKIYIYIWKFKYYAMKTTTWHQFLPSTENENSKVDFPRRINSDATEPTKGGREHEPAFEQY